MFFYEKKTKNSKEVKIKACKDYDSFSGIADKIGVTKEVVHRWYLRYKEHGPSTFKTLSRNQSYR